MTLSNALPEFDLHLRTHHAPALPRQLYIEVTNHCNSLCISCPLTYDHFLPYEPKHHLSWENFQAIVDQVPVIDRAVLHGIGEPLLNRDLPRFVAHLKRRGAHVLFNTNGVLLDERRGDALVEAGWMNCASPSTRCRRRSMPGCAGSTNCLGSSPISRPLWPGTVAASRRVSRSGL